MTEVETREVEETPPEGPSWMDQATGVGTSVGRSLLYPTLALITSLVIGAVIIAFSDAESLQILFADPGTALSNMAAEVWLSYRALFRGAVGSVNAISETLFATTPLLLAGLGVALGFRAGLFNIGAQGQMLIGAIVTTYVGLYVTAPGFLHLPLALLAGFVGGMVWGGVTGALKAKTGAHEVITTIMFNFIALFFLQWILTTP
jgi:simple sugar transport system permease protein